jgi:uncharacterized protein YndB with AHSA1/START domain
VTSEVRLRKSIRASRQELFRACATTEGLERWYADRVTGAVVRGGTVRLEWSELDASVQLRVTEVVPDERLVFENAGSRLTLEISDGRVDLVHEGPGVAEDVPGFASSWTVALSVLSHALTMHPGKPRRTRWISRPAKTSASRAYLCFTEPEAIAMWLGKDAEVGAEDEPYELVLAHGETMEGTVLSRVEGRDVAYTWKDRDDSVLVMRTLPLATRGERLVALCWSLWSRKAPGEDAVVEALERAVERLGRVLLQSGDA